MVLTYINGGDDRQLHCLLTDCDLLNRIMAEVGHRSFRGTHRTESSRISRQGRHTESCRQQTDNGKQRSRHSTQQEAAGEGSAD